MAISDLIGREVLYYCHVSTMELKGVVVKIVDDSILQLDVEGMEGAYRYIVPGQIREIYERDTETEVCEDDG